MKSDNPKLYDATENPNSIADAIYGCNSYELLKSAGGLIETGPTGTNVADIRIVLTQPTSD